jgi:hypothetical protein
MYAATTVPTSRGDPLARLEMLMARKPSEEEEEAEVVGAVAYSGMSHAALKQHTRDRHRPNRSALR